MSKAYRSMRAGVGWGRLGSSALYEGRDLQTTTDFGAVLSAVMSEHMGVLKGALAQIFPGFSSKLDPFVHT